MSHEKTTLEVIAPSVEEAVNRGLDQLGLPADAVDVEVLDSGSRGLFGLGSRQARVRLSIKSEQPTPVQQEQRRIESLESPAVAEQPAVPPSPSKPERVAEGVEPSSEHQEAMKVATEVVTELLDKMKIQANVQAEIVPPADENDESLVMVEVRGDDLSILIGRRSETLNSLQYISSLIVAKELGRWVPMSIDVQGYRARRERQLRTLARRMAEQAIHTGRRQTLEPMPANERRLVHLELRDHPEVYTESVGEDPNRKVTILLKKTPSRE